MTSPSSRTARIVTTVKPEKILIAMSGGVDSSVAALLLSEAGCECVGATMRLFHNEDAGVSREKSCCSLEDAEDARSVAYQLGMPFYVFNFTDGFGEQVMDRFVDAYERGATPNPCIDCNRYMKFAKLVERAELLGCDAVATGHYARIEQENGRWLLKKAVDDSKQASSTIRSASARDWASASSIRTMSARSARRTTPSCSARMRPCSPRSWMRAISTGSLMIRRPPSCTSRQNPLPPAGAACDRHAESGRHGACLVR